MRCPIADKLRAKWYATAILIPAQYRENYGVQVQANRQTPEYIAAKAALIEHLKTCPECRALLALVEFTVSEDCQETK